MSRYAQFYESDPRAREMDGTAPSARLSCDALFAAAREPVLIVETPSGLIVNANPAAGSLLQIDPAQLIGARLESAFDEHSATCIETSFTLTQLQGGTHELNIRARHGGEAMCARVCLFRAAEQSYFLMRLASSEASASKVAGSSDLKAFKVIDGAPVGFLITDLNFHIHYANRAFIAMLDLASQADVRGECLARWLDFGEAQRAAMRRQLGQRQAVSRLMGSLSSARSGVRRVEVEAIAVPDGPGPCWGFSVTVLPLLN
jgi:PAS domain-containing protein